MNSNTMLAMACSEQMLRQAIEILFMILGADLADEHAEHIISEHLTRLVAHTPQPVIAGPTSTARH